ncbi:MAG: hypothetical protein Q9222_003420 [Ikaeria aurantiellina]
MDFQSQNRELRLRAMEQDDKIQDLEQRTKDLESQLQRKTGTIKSIREDKLYLSDDLEQCKAEVMRLKEVERDVQRLRVEESPIVQEDELDRLRQQAERYKQSCDATTTQCINGIKGVFQILGPLRDCTISGDTVDIGDALSELATWATEMKSVSADIVAFHTRLFPNAPGFATRNQIFGHIVDYIGETRAQKENMGTLAKSAAVEQEIQKLSAQNTQLLEKTKGLKEQRMSLEAKLLTSEQAQAQWETQATDALDGIDAIRSQLQGAQKELESAQGKISDLEKDRDCNKDKYRECSSELDTRMQEIRDLNQQLESSRREYATLESMVAAAEHRPNEHSLHSFLNNNPKTKKNQPTASFLSYQSTDSERHASTEGNNSTEEAQGRPKRAKRATLAARANARVSPKAQRQRSVAFPSSASCSHVMGPQATERSDNEDIPHQEAWYFAHEMRDPSFKYDDLPREIFATIRNQMDSWDKRRPEWANGTANGVVKCANQWSGNHGSNIEDGYACRNCTDNGLVCVAVRKGKLQLRALPPVWRTGVTTKDQRNYWINDEV